MGVWDTVRDWSGVAYDLVRSANPIPAIGADLGKIAADSPLDSLTYVANRGNPITALADDIHGAYNLLKPNNSYKPVNYFDKDYMDELIRAEEAANPFAQSVEVPLSPIEPMEYTDKAPWLSDIKSVPEYVPEGELTGQANASDYLNALALQAANRDARWSQQPTGFNTADLNPLFDAFSAFYDENTPAGRYQKRLRDMRQLRTANARADEELQIHRMNALAQLMNASKQSAQLSNFGKIYRDAIAAGKSQDEAYALAERAVTKPMIDMSTRSEQKRRDIEDTELGKLIFSEDLSGPASKARMNSDMLIDLLEKDKDLLSYSGRLGAEGLYTIGQKLGLTGKETNEALQLLRDTGTSYRQLIGKSTVGGGQVSNYEQEIIAASIPGLDKTREQNLLAAKANRGLAKMTEDIVAMQQRMYREGASATEIGKAVREYREEAGKALYEELFGKQKMSSGNISSSPGLYYVKGVAYEKGEDGNYHIVKGYING